MVPARELVFIEIGERRRRGRDELRTRSQGAVGGHWCKALVPRTYVLADVASEEPVARHPRFQIRERPTPLDGEVGDAAARVERARRGERAGGAGVETAGTGAAAVELKGKIGLQRRIGEHDADEREGTELRIDQH